VPVEPSDQEVGAAAVALEDIIADFPFRDAAHKAGFLSALLTPFARWAFEGPSPLFLMDANTPGSGKTLLCQVVSTIASGGAMASMSNTMDDEEMRKRITAIMLAGTPMVFIDNVSGLLGTPSLDGALTGTRWSDRYLGKSRNVEGELRVTWFATGNNVQLQGDTVRRIVHIRLRTPEERPEERADFRYPRLLETIQERRPSLVLACLTILRGYMAAGAPVQNLKPWGSYEGWSSVVRGAVTWLGMDDPGETRRELASQSDRNSGVLVQFLNGLEDVDPITPGRDSSPGLTAARIVQLITDSPGAHEALKTACEELSPPRSGKVSAGGLGKRLAGLRERVIMTDAGARWLDREHDRSKTWIWQVRRNA